MVLQTKVFVGSLPQGSRPEELRKLFERFGTVTECDIMNRCGFVHMQTEEQATAAIRALNNSTFNGGAITVERGRIKERGARGGGARGGMRGGLRGAPERRGGGPVRGPPPARDAPYMRDARPMPMRDLRGPPMGGMARNGMGAAPYERGMERALGGYEERYGGYGGEDRRGFALMDRREQYGAPAPLYEERRGYGGVEELAPLYDERRAALYDERELLERRALRAPLPLAAGYERARAAPMGNGDMFSRRSPMRGASAGAYDRDPYAQQYPPMGRSWVPR
ncbi:uncharacterized protein [Epargyreus clarus]|uniref:uncharacterized protein isoform X2 n=1 Tax=Epargyreus clarus TaxID=520877 RepID=UPI003C2DEE9E